MKLNNIMNYFKYYLEDPCETGTKCVVRAGCTIKGLLVSTKKTKCPTYKEYAQRKDRFDSFIGGSQEWFFIILMIWFFLMILVTFGFGVWKWFELAKGLFE